MKIDVIIIVWLVVHGPDFEQQPGPWLAFIAHWGFCGCLLIIKMHIIKYGDPLYMQELGLYSYNVLCTLYMATLINKPLAKFCYVQE